MHDVSDRRIRVTREGEAAVTKNAAGNLCVPIRHGWSPSLEIAEARDSHFRARKRSHLLAGLLVSMAVMLWSAAAFAQPTLEADCGTGASIVGSDSAGKVTVGTGVSTCTVDFSSAYTSAPACSATDETNNGGNPEPMGLKSTTTTLVLGGTREMSAGDVVSYICASY